MARTLSVSLFAEGVPNTEFVWICLCILMMKVGALKHIVISKNFYRKAYNIHIIYMNDRFPYSIVSFN